MEPKKLARILEREHLVDRLLVDRVLSKLKQRETLADRLVADGHVTEADLLRAVAKATNTRFVEKR